MARSRLRKVAKPASPRSAQDRAYRAANAERYRGYELKRSFGIDLGEYQRMFVRQDGVCAICKQPEVSKRNGKTKWLAVDHNHSTGEIRGLLCTKCNPMLGYADEEPDRLVAAAKYLESFAVNDKNVVPLPRAVN